MQTVIVVQSSVAGAVYLSGRMAGEVDAERPLTLPVSPFGALILELRPFLPGFLPLTLRIPFSHGRPLISAPDPRLCAALWPGGVVELELLPEPVPSPAAAHPLAQTGEVRLSFQEAPPAVRCESSAALYVHPLPAGAQMPTVTPVPSGIMLSGKLTGTPDGQYAIILSPDASSVLLSLTGQNLTLLDGGAALRLLHAYGDTVGHAVLETWAFTHQGWQLSASEPMWLSGAPVRPETPEATAIAAIEAAQLGFMNEAAACFSSAFAYRDVLAKAAGFDGCVPLRHPAPGGEPAVGLMRLRDNILHIIPARYSASPGGMRGAWQLTGLEIDEER